MFLEVGQIVEGVFRLERFDIVLPFLWGYGKAIEVLGELIFGIGYAGS